MRGWIFCVNVPDPRSPAPARRAFADPLAVRGPVMYGNMNASQKQAVFLTRRGPHMHGGILRRAHYLMIGKILCRNRRCSAVMGRRERCMLHVRCTLDVGAAYLSGPYFWHRYVRRGAGMVMVVQFPYIVACVLFLTRITDVLIHFARCRRACFLWNGRPCALRRGLSKGWAHLLCGRV